MQQNNTLPEEIRQQIKDEAKDCADFNWGDQAKIPATDYMRIHWNHCYEDHTVGATVWATRYQEVVEENARLRKALEGCVEYMNNGQLDFHTILDNAEEALAQKGGDADGA